LLSSIEFGCSAAFRNNTVGVNSKVVAEGVAYRIPEKENKGEAREVRRRALHTQIGVCSVYYCKRKRVLWGRRGEGVGVVRDRAEASEGGPS
jgi:hypothetical protein